MRTSRASRGGAAAGNGDAMNIGAVARTGIVAGALAAVYVRFGRARVLTWGATPDEAARAMPGDDVLPDATLVATRAIGIDAAPEYVWPWLVQMGPTPRAGAYTYDWIERLLGIDIESGDRILPEFQHIEQGDAIAINDRGEGLVVREVDPQRALVLQWVPAESTWTFGLYADDGARRTRLVSRNRLRVRGPLAWLGMVAVMEPGSLVMERKMLLGIKQRAESLARSRTGVQATTDGHASG
jgi:hypothetical protein